jgi:hypothetical protein
MPHQIDDLRTHLFETLVALRDKANPMDLDRARAIADVSKVIVESAKVEVDFLKVTGATKSTNFLPIEDEAPARPALPARPQAVSPAVSPAAETKPVRQVDGQSFEVMFDGRKDQSLLGDRRQKRA